MALPGSKKDGRHENASSPLDTYALGPILRLIPTLHWTAKPRRRRNCKDPLTRRRTPDPRQLLKKSRRLDVARFTRATTLGPFLTLLLTLHNRSSWIDDGRWQVATTPRGAV